MKRTPGISIALGALALGFAAAPVSAAPLNGPKTGEAIAPQSSLTEHVRHRCHWHRGALYCPRHGYRRYHHYYGYDYGPGPYAYGPGPYAYGPGFYGPGFGLHFGGRGWRW